MGQDETGVHTIGVGRTRRRLRQMARPSPRRGRPEVAAMARSEPPGRGARAGRSDGRRSQPHQRNWGAKSSDEHADCKERRREEKSSPDDRRPPGCRLLSLSVRRSPIVGMASAEKGQQARSEIGYPGHVERPRGRPTNSVTMNPTWLDHEGVHDWIMNPPSSRFIRPSPVGAQPCGPSRPNRCGSSLTPSYRIMNPLDWCFVISDLEAVQADDNEVLRARFETR